jgi:hypothetical protein
MTATPETTRASWGKLVTMNQGCSSLRLPGQKCGLRLSP